MTALRPATRDDLAALPLEVAPRLLGGVLRVSAAGETVAVRLTEVEAYHGRGTGAVPDPGSHARMAPRPATPRCGASPGTSTCI